MKNLNRDFLTVLEFAELVGAHPNSIRNMIRSGRLGAFKIGGGKTSSWRIPRIEINRMAEIDLEEIVNGLVKKKIGNCSK